MGSLTWSQSSTSVSPPGQKVQVSCWYLATAKRSSGSGGGTPHVERAAVKAAASSASRASRRPATESLAILLGVIAYPREWGGLGARPFALRQHQVAQRLAPAGLRPGTDLDADGAAVGLGEVGNALVEVHVPALLPADPLLFLMDRIGRTVDHAAAAMRADVVHPDVLGGVRRERHVGEDRGEPEVGAVLAS